MSIVTPSRTRYAYLDFLRVAAVFLVIVNHTNSLVFQKLTPTNFTWWLSIVWYYLSKIAVPLFIMVSGACLLPLKDSYRRVWARFVRMLLVLILFSYAYYLVDLWQTYWTWEKALDIPAFLLSIWQMRITDSFWYLYFYLGLIVMLPLLQRLAHAMSKEDLLYLMGVSFTVYAAWPLLTHYVPQAALPLYFDVPLCAVFIGLFFAGHYVQHFTGKGSVVLSLLVLLLSLGASVWLTYVEYGQVGVGGKYWFMDERTAPSLFTIIAALAFMKLARRAFTSTEQREPSGARFWAVVGGCSFGMYLLQDLIIAETRYRFFVPMSGVLNPLLAAFIWEVGVFTIAFALAWLLKHVPLLRKIL